MVRKLRIILDNYDKNENKDNNFINNNLTSYEFRSNMLKRGSNKTINNLKNRYFNDSVEEKPNTYRQETINNKFNLKANYLSNNNNSLNNKNRMFYKLQNKSCKNSHNVIKKHHSYRKDITNSEAYEKRNDTIRTNDENYLRKISNNRTISRIKLMNIEIKKGNKNLYNNTHQQRSKKNQSQSLISWKNMNKEYKIQEQYILKIKLFIKFIEKLYISSLHNFFIYFKKKLLLYGMEKNEENKDYQNLLKRFQKSRNRKNDNNSALSFNRINNNTISNTYELNKKKLECKIEI